MVKKAKKNGILLLKNKSYCENDKSLLHEYNKWICFVTLLQ